MRLESVHNALEQAKTAAANICGEDLSYAQIPWFWSDQYDLKLQIAGLAQGYDDVVLRGDPADNAFACLYLRDGRVKVELGVGKGRAKADKRQAIAERDAEIEARREMGRYAKGV